MDKLICLSIQVLNWSDNFPLQKFRKVWQFKALQSLAEPLLVEFRLVKKVN